MSSIIDAEATEEGADRELSVSVGIVGERSHLPRIPPRKHEQRDFHTHIAEFAAALASWLVRLIPDRLANRMTVGVGRLSYHRFNGYRGNVRANVEQVMAATSDLRNIDEIVKGIFVTNALNALELLRVPHMSSSAILDCIQVVEGDWSQIDRVLAEGRGVIIVTAHVGAFDFVGNALHHSGYELTTLTTRTTSRFVFEAISFLRRSHRMRIVNASRAGVRTVVRALAKGECVALVSDRDFVLSGRKATFFGKETTLPVGAARLARDTGAVIVPMSTKRSGNTHLLYIEPPIEVPITADR